MQKPLYADAIAYFEKLEKKHDYQANKAKWQGRSEQRIENIQRKKEYARMAAEALRQMEGEEYGDTTTFENIGLPMQGLPEA